MPVATITLESLLHGQVVDSIVVSAPDDNFLDDDIILDTGPDGIYDTAFTARTVTAAFAPGGRIIGDSIPIRELTLPFHLTPASRPRFQRLWGTPGNFRKVRYHYDGPSGRRSLTLRLSKQIAYQTEDGFDAALDDAYHAVAVPIAVNPMFEGFEDTAEWINPGNFTFYLAATSGTYRLGYGGQLTTPIAYNADAATIRAALEALSTIGAGNVTVTGSGGKFTVHTPATQSGMLTIDGTALTPVSFSITLGTLNYTLTYGGQTTAPIGFLSSAATIKQALEQLSNIGTGGVTVTATLFGFTLSFSTGSIIALLTGKSTAGFHVAYVTANPNTGWFNVWNPTDQDLWNEWELDPAKEWQFPDFAFNGAERKWNRPIGSDAARMIVAPELTQMLSIMSDPLMDTYINADLSNAAGLFNGVEPVYPVPQYTGTAEDPILMPVVCRGPAGAKATLSMRRWWSSESGLEAAS